MCVVENFIYLCTMEKEGLIEIRITGTKGNLDLTPDNYDIRELIGMLENVEGLLYSGDKKDRPLISYRIEDGSVKHIFRAAIQYIIGFNAVIGQINQIQNIDFLEHKTAKAFESLQEIATNKNFVFNLKTSLEHTNEVEINNTTRFFRTETIWADAEFYFYGKITNAGGKNRANIHIFTAEMGMITIQTPISFLEKYEENMLYKTLGIRASGKQNVETGEIDKSSLIFVEIVEYQQKYDSRYLENLREKAKNNWLGIINPDSWLREIRGSYDA